MEDGKVKTEWLVYDENDRNASLQTPRKSLRDGVKPSFINMKFSRMLHSNAHCQRSGPAITK
jgi:hypothetical protein